MGWGGKKDFIITGGDGIPASLPNLLWHHPVRDPCLQPGKVGSLGSALSLCWCVWGHFHFMVFGLSREYLFCLAMLLLFRSFYWREQACLGLLFFLPALVGVYRWQAFSVLCLRYMSWKESQGTHHRVVPCVSRFLICLLSSVHCLESSYVGLVCNIQSFCLHVTEGYLFHLYRSISLIFI